MRPTLTSVLMVFLTIACVADDPNTASHESAREFQFDGTWKPKGAMLGGVLLPPPALEGITLTIKGDRYEVEVKGEAKSDKGTASRDESVTPHRMTIRSIEGPNAGKTVLAIYEIKGPNAYRVCYDLSGKDFPQEFKSTKGSQLYLVGYRRQLEATTE